jgi:PAS domain S-box-containing protein
MRRVRARSGLSLRGWLIFLVLASILPLLIFILGFEYLDYRNEVAATGQQTLALARSMALLVDEELQGRVEGLQALTVSRALQAGDLETFRTVALAAEQFPGGNLLLIRADGQQLMNTLRPPGTALPVRQDMESTKQVFTTGLPAVSNLFRSATDSRPVVAIDVPVRAADGGVALVLSLNPGLKSFSDVIRRQHLPANWLVAVFDRSGVTVARVPDGDRYVGQKAAPDFLGPLQADREGFIQNTSREGIPVLSAFSHADRFGWAVAIGVPRAELMGPALTAAMRTLEVGGILLVAGLAIALYAARRIAGPIQSLRRLAATTDPDALLKPTLTGLPETDEVAEALRSAEENRRQSETLLRQFIDQAPVGIAMFDRDMRYLAVSERWLTDYQLDTEIIGRSHYEVFPDIPERWKDIHRRCLAGASEQSDGDQFLRDDSEAQWLRWKIRPWYGSADEIGGLIIFTEDITDRKETAAALESSEERFRRVFEAVSSAIIMVGADGMIEMLNVQAEKIFGHPRAELLGRPIEVLLPERYRSHHPGLRNVFFAAPQARLMGIGRDLYALRQDGQEFPVEIGLSPIETEAGAKVLVSVLDITTRHQAELMKAYYAAIFESSGDAIIAKDLDGVVTSWNKAAELMFGYSASEMVGEPITRLLPADSLNEETAILAKIRRGERIDHFETSRMRKDGTEIPVSLTISPILGPAGEIIGASKIVRDITERNRMQATLLRSEDRFRSIFSAVSEGIFILSPAGIFTEVNDAGCRMLGYTSEELIGGDIQMISSGVSPHTQADAMEWHAKAKATGRPQRFDWQCKAKEGRLFGAEVSIQFASISGQEVVLAMLRDVTDRQAIEGQLRQAQKMEAVGQLTGGLAHDFNNLLGIVLGNLDLLAERFEPGLEARELTDAAIGAAARGAELTRQLLAFSRRQPLAPKVTYLPPVLEATGSLLRRTLGEAVTLELKFSDALWPVLIDVSQLESTLLNLSVNARDAMPQGGRVTIEGANTVVGENNHQHNVEAIPGEYVLIAVSDTGGGMPPEVLAHVFEPFFTTKGNGGTGLGLSMVHGFLKQSGGYTGIYSELGRGTTIRLYLPRALEGEEAVQIETRPTETLVGGQELILVVEDNEGLRDIAVRQLQELGYRTLPAGDGTSALEIIRGSAPIDLLFTDVVMPGGLDGRALANAARRERPQLKVLFTSGFTAAAASAATEDQFGSNLLSKPYRKGELAGRVRAALDTS